MSSSSNAKQPSVVIIGAGIVGVSTAIWLQRAGIKSTVIDKVGPAGGTSYGNAGVLAAGSIVPVPVPGLLKKAPGMLFDSEAPLFLRWAYLPKLIPFLMKYLSNSKNEKVQEISKQLDVLLHDTASQHKALCAGTPAEKYFNEGDYLFGYADKAAFDADQYAWNIRRSHGVEFEEMDAQKLAAYDPAMTGRFGYAVRCPNHGRISDPGAYVEALAAHAKDEGCTFITDEVLSIETEEGNARSVVTKNGTIECSHVVLASGAWSAKLASQMGVNSNLEAERGYHIEFVNPSIMPKNPIMVASGKYVMTPMDGRLRCAGIVEFGGLNDIRSKAPFELLKRQTKELLPELTYDRIDEWMGHRPSTTDSLPLIGAIDKVSNVWCGFGHQHVGLTGGPKTGRWLAQLISGEKPNTDLTPFAPDRFQ